MSVWTSAISPATRSVDRAEAGGEVLHVGRGSKSGLRAHDQVDAGGDHRRRVDEGADRRRALHRVREPRLERELRRLGDRAAEQAERDEVRDRRAVAESPSPRTTIAKSSEPGVLDQQEEREHHRRVADRVHDERLLRRGDRARPLVPEADQQVATRGRRGPSRRAGAAGSPPGRAAASRRRTAPCTRSSAAPRRRRPCSRSSRRRSATPTPETISIMKTDSGSTRMLRPTWSCAGREPRPGGRDVLRGRRRRSPSSADEARRPRRRSDDGDRRRSRGSRRRARVRRVAARA